MNNRYSESTRRTTRGRVPTRSRVRSLVTALQVAILIGVAVFVGIALALFVNLSGVLPTVETIEPPEATIIYSSDNVILGRIYHEDRTNVPLKDIPKSLRNATIAIEDSRFYQHSGLDFRGIARAVFQNLRGKKLAQGGSTITQQLARNVYLTQQKTMQRKVQEAVLATLIERHFTKDKILELYLNQVYYGSGAFGVQAASKVYFGKDVDKLDLSECAMLAGLPQRPSGYSPHEDIQSAMDRRDIVLNRMAELGYITDAERDSAKAEILNIIPRSKGRSTFKAPQFVDYVTKIVREQYGDDVFRSGLRVYTTLNYQMQVAAEKALREGVKRHEQLRKDSEGCFVCIEPESGYIRAMVGSVDPNSQYNRCTQAGRQPGSSFKAFVYTAALAAGMSPYDRILDAPISFPGVNGKRWAPRNYDDRYHGWVTMKSAVAQSINIPAIKVAHKIGIQNVIKYAQLMGITAELEPYLPLAIGGIKGVHPIEMASAYGTFANDGVYVAPTAIIRVTNNHGDPIQDYVPEGRRVISEKINSEMDDMLREVVVGRRGTGHAAGSVSQARGKTGTTNDDRDAWWIGYVPKKLVAACWVGNDNNTPMRHAFGGEVCAPIWRDFMQKAIPVYDKIHADKKKQSPKTEIVDQDMPKADQPKTVRHKRKTVETTDNNDSASDSNSDVVRVRICNDSQLLATPNCPATHIETFVKGTEPTSYCNIHTREKTSSRKEKPRKSAESSDTNLITVRVCPITGQLAGPNCPGHGVKKRLPLDEVPTQVCTLHNHE